MALYKCKLSALNYATPEAFNINDERAFKHLIVWLEDHKIRHYKLEHRSGLRDIASQSWPSTYHRYLADLACPIKSGNREEELDWLLMFSVKLEYADNIEKYRGNGTDLKTSDVAKPKVVSENPLDNIDFNSPDFVQGVNKLADLLKIGRHPDHLVTVKAITKLVSQRLTQKAIDDPESILTKGDVFPFENADSGFTLGDPVLNKAAKVLRLLYIHDLRKLQTSINEIIVAVQTITADPKTDTKLGQVGR